MLSPLGAGVASPEGHAKARPARSMSRAGFDRGARDS